MRWVSCLSWALPASSCCKDFTFSMRPASCPRGLCAIACVSTWVRAHDASTPCVPDCDRPDQAVRGLPTAGRPAPRWELDDRSWQYAHGARGRPGVGGRRRGVADLRSEEHTSELKSQ